MNDSTSIDGVLHGRTIELNRDPNLPDGQAVTIVLRPISKPENVSRGKGLREAFGGWVDDAIHLDAFIEQVYRDRDDSRGENVP